MHKIWVMALVGIIVLFAGCTSGKTVSQYKNDIVTIENLVVSNVAPYSGDTITIDLDVKNNGDRPISVITVNFFDTPGFTITGLKCETAQMTSDDLKKRSPCNFFSGSPEGVVEPLDSRHVTLSLQANTVASPTPFTVSLSIRYGCNFGSATETSSSCAGSREVILPIIDGVIKKEPSFKFSQSPPNYGPIVIDIQPQVEHTKTLNRMTVKEYWGTLGQSFTTKFVIKHVGTLKEKVKPINVAVRSLELYLSRLDATKKIGTTSNYEPIGSCDFNILSEGCGRTSGTVAGQPYDSCKNLDETFNTLVCTFAPTSYSGFETEFTSTIKISYQYSYEFIKSLNFVVQPRR